MSFGYRISIYAVVFEGNLAEDIYLGSLQTELIRLLINLFRNLINPTHSFLYFQKHGTPPRVRAPKSEQRSTDFPH